MTAAKVAGMTAAKVARMTAPKVARMTPPQVDRRRPAPPARCAALIAIAAGLGGCGCGPDGGRAIARGGGAAATCRLDEAPTIVGADGAAVLLRWELDARPVLFSPALPDDDGYRAYRRAIRDAGAELREPIADRAPPATDRERETWRREDHNASIVFAGRAGTLRPIGCLEALMFARQHARFSQLT
jgi:hypothetical protein